MNRAYVMTPVDAASDAVMIVYRPGVTAGAEAVAHALFGDCAIAGKLPWQIPATMDQVMLQREDLPKDIEIRCMITVSALKWPHSVNKH